MIDFDALENEVGTGNDDEMLMFTRGEMLELITRLRQAEKDAARYRELRDAESETCVEFINAKARMASPEWLDGLVDEYINASNN